MRILVTGTAGFIGFHFAKRLIRLGHEVTGIDNINTYYDTRLKFDRLAANGIAEDAVIYGKKIQSEMHPNYTFHQLDITDQIGMQQVFSEGNFDVVCNLAAQAGVRYSLENPHAYIQSNIEGFLNILEGCKMHSVKHLIYASSSSVYGLNESMPFNEDAPADHPVSLYAATKKANELMAHSYSSLYKLPTTGLRFFTVYGPWGRPDMALFKFTGAILNHQPVHVYNNGLMFRDFTYIDDVIEAMELIINTPATTDIAWNPLHPCCSTSSAPYRIYNIGNSKPVSLLDYIYEIESQLGIEAQMVFLPMQAGDVRSTSSDTLKIRNDFGFVPKTDIKTGIAKFIGWYKSYYKG